MYEKEYDRIFVPFTTKMTSLEELFHKTLTKEIEKYVLITKEWLQTQEGLEYVHTKNNSNTTLEQELQQHHINTNKLEQLLLTQYNIGKSYAQKNINRTNKKLTLSDKKSINKLLKGVNKIIKKFDNIIIRDIKQFINKQKNNTIQEIIEKLPQWINQNHTTPISAKTRSEMIARTEMNRSFTNGVLQTYSNYGLNEVNIINYNDKGICETCINLIQNNPYTIEEAMKILPVHPFCRCISVLNNTTNIPLEEIENPIIIDMFLT